jgi:FAD/FMN-containing dehydrogenase/Fe-S oxidoreductase
MTRKTAASDFINDLSSVIQGEVHADRLTREIYSSDASDFRRVPAAVVVPRNIDDIIAAIQTARRHEAPLIARGGGSSTSGQVVGTGLIVDHSKYLNRILELNVEERWAWVEAGVVLDRLNFELARHGLMIGPDPSSSPVATLGGMAGNNSTGAHSIRYGLMVDHVLEMEVVLADGSRVRLNPKDADAIRFMAGQNSMEGRIYREIPRLLDAYGPEIETRYPKTWRNVAGYNLNRLRADRIAGGGLNLASLIVGSEGTLAFITRIKLRLVDKPRRVRLMVLHFNGLNEALEKVPLILESRPAAVELMTYPILKLAHDHAALGPRLRTFLQGLPGAILIVEFAGAASAEVANQAVTLQRRLHKDGYDQHIAHCVSDEEVARVWSIRKAVLGLGVSNPAKPKRTGIIDDAAVPVESLISFTRQVSQASRQYGIDIGFDAHASAGCLHMNPEIDLRTAQGMKSLELLSRDIMAIAISLGGTTTGEHGEGLARSWCNPLLYGPRLHQAFREVKDLFDPDNRLNPGKIVNGSEPWARTDWFKWHPDYRTPHAPRRTFFDFSAYSGYAGLVDMCNGQGICRGTVHGSMCPSFRVTGDELHSPRGRANALRAALTGELGTDGLTSREAYRALDLCLECKACRTECSTRVDMAKLKYEFLAHYQARRGVPLRSRLFAALPHSGRIGGVAPKLTNRIYQLAAFRRLLDRTVGIDQRRELPSIAPVSFQRWFRQRPQRPTAGRPRVILWDDCHISHHQPALGRDAVRILEAAGFEVICIRQRKCCGRPLISKGLLNQARDNARHNVRHLLPHAQDGVPIIGVEPSCIACFRDEYPDLLRSEESRKVAAQSFFFEEFLCGLADRGQLSLNFAIPTRPRRILLHTHCYQKAFGTAANVVGMLQLLPDTQVREIAAGCCGMAGSFGYEKEHYDVSMAIGEQVLFPAIREAAAHTIIAAAGTSCREQIKNGTRRRARHPVSILAEALVGSPVQPVRRFADRP